VSKKSPTSINVEKEVPLKEELPVTPAASGHKGARTKEFIRSQAAPLFNKKGFDGTSLGDLTAVTGLTKGALYGNFKNKEGIALAAFGYSMQHIRALMKMRLDRHASNKQKLAELLDFFAEYAMHPPIPGGCPMLNYGVDADDNHRFMRKAVSKEIVATTDFIRTCFQRGVQAGEFSSTIDAASLAHMFFCAIEGAILISRVTGSPAPMHAVVAHCRSVLDGISC
jgi:TetR/AcrR family transcriptional regulator, transcriptional repressor for nem operon